MTVTAAITTTKGGTGIFAPPSSRGCCYHRDRAIKTATGGGIYLEDNISLSSQTFASAKSYDSWICEAAETCRFAPAIEAAAAPKGETLAGDQQQPTTAQEQSVRRMHQEQGKTIIAPYGIQPEASIKTSIIHRPDEPVTTLTGNREEQQLSPPTRTSNIARGQGMDLPEVETIASREMRCRNYV